MFKIPLPEVKEKILASNKITPRDLEIRIKDKINELSGLISEEGAAHIIANELGIELISQSQGPLKIKEIYAGMRNVSAVGKVLRKFEPREFSKNDKKGRVCSCVLGDETGTIRVVFWNDQVSLLDKVQEDDVLQIKAGYVKENNGGRELHLGERSEIAINPAGVSVNNVRQGTAAYVRKTIAELKEGDEGAEILGTIIQVFDPRYFTVCSQCNKRVTEQDGTAQCADHGIVQPIFSYVMNLVVDDGSGNIRGVFWKNQTNQLLQKSEQEMNLYRENQAGFEDVKTDLLGEQIKMTGRIKKNEMFDRLEFNVQLVEKAKPEEELARLEKAGQV